jgi:hypothetical protein
MITAFFGLGFFPSDVNGNDDGVNVGLKNGCCQVEMRE